MGRTARQTIERLTTLVVAAALTAAAPTRQPLTPDQTFLTAAAVDGLKEVAMGRLASTRGDSPAVRDFDRMMVADHSTVDDVMLTTAVGAGLAPPKDLPPHDQAAYDTLHGKAFDQAYVQAAFEDREQDITEYQQEVDHGTDKFVKGLARNALPMLRHHSEAAQTVAASVGK